MLIDKTINTTYQHYKKERNHKSNANLSVDTDSNPKPPETHSTSADKDDHCTQVLLFLHSTVTQAWHTGEKGQLPPVSTKGSKMK